MTKNGNNTLSWRVTQLESNYRETSNKLDLIMENHLPHLNSEIASLKTRVAVLSIINLGALVLAVVFKYL